MLKFDIRKQPDIMNLTEVLVNKLVEEANEVKEAFRNENKSWDDYFQELLDVQQIMLAIFSQYKSIDDFYNINEAMKEHNKKLATSHKERYGLGDIQYIGCVTLCDPIDCNSIEELINDNKDLKKCIKELTQDKSILELLLKEGKPKELAEKEEEIYKLKEEVNQLRIENGEYRDIIGRIENYLQELKRQ